MLGRAVPGQEFGEIVEYVIGAQSPCDDDLEAGHCELVDHRQRAKFAFVLGLMLHEPKRSVGCHSQLVARYVVWLLRSQTDA